MAKGLIVLIVVLIYPELQLALEPGNKSLCVLWHLAGSRQTCIYLPRPQILKARGRLREDRLTGPLIDQTSDCGSSWNVTGVYFRMRSGFHTDVFEGIAFQTECDLGDARSWGPINRHFIIHLSLLLCTEVGKPVTLKCLFGHFSLKYFFYFVHVQAPLNMP